MQKVEDADAVEILKETHRVVDAARRICDQAVEIAEAGEINLNWTGSLFDSIRATEDNVGVCLQHIDESLSNRSIANRRRV